MQSLVARQTLDAARYFSSQAAAAENTGTPYRYNLEAALVFGRSVTFHLQKQLSGSTQYCDWYETWRAAMASDPVCKFFVEKRNFVLKEGRVNFNYTLSVEDVAVVVSFAHVELKVNRGRPWYRRPFRIIIEDALRPLREWRRRVNEQRAHARRLASAQPKRTPIPPVTGFVDFRPNEPALKVLDEYLSFLERVVVDAEGRFA